MLVIIEKQVQFCSFMFYETEVIQDQTALHQEFDYCWPKQDSSGRLCLLSSEEIVLQVSKT